MFALPPIVAILVIDYLKPQEYFPILARLPLLYLFTALALLGFLVDVRLNLSRLVPTPQLPFVILFFLWCLVTVAANDPAGVTARAQAIFIPISLYLIIAHTLQTFRALEITLGVLLGICLVLAFIGVHQGLSPWGCYQLTVRGGQVAKIYDGRECVPHERTCEAEGAEPGADYDCERVGLLGTQSDAGRVRYRGTLNDPNDLALTLGMAVPFAFGFVARRRRLARMALLLVTCALIGLCVIFTESRGGQIVFLAVLGVYFTKRYGWRGVVAGLCLALPILLFGGRSGAEDSTIERTECWYIGMRLFLAAPIFGVGSGLFTDHHYLTAHNSYILSSAELGMPGMVIWSAILYLSMKIPVTALRTGAARPGRAGYPPVAMTWSLALLASVAGLLVGILFLSWTYKEFLWIYVGLTGVLYQAIRRHDPGFKIRFGWRDLGLVVGIDVVLQAALTVWTTYKVG